MRGRSRLRRELLAAVLFLPVTAPALAQEIDFVDLTTVGPNPLQRTRFIADDSCNGGFVGAAYGIGCPAKTYPFRLLLLNVDNNAIEMGSEVTALLRLENIGHDAALVPIGTDPDEIELPDENGRFRFMEADFSASLNQASGRNILLLPERLYGSEAAPGTLQAIGPGEYVEITIKLAVDCKHHDPLCQQIEAGPAKLTFSWSESQNEETYEKCGTQSAGIRTRELTTDEMVVEILQPLTK